MCLKAALKCLTVSVVIMASMKVCFLLLVGAAICQAASHRVHISRKHPNLHSIQRMLERAKGVEPVVSRDGDFFYSGNITVGTPPQTFVTDFDTGSSDLWILDSTCKSADCKDTPLFQKDQSSTFKSDNVPEMIGYAGKNYVKGVRAYETLTVSGLSIESQPFILVNESNGNHEIKSLFGLSNQAKSGTPPFYHFVEQKVVDKPILTVFLEKSADNTFGGDITFGDYDTKNCGPVYATTKSTERDWIVKVNSISINDKKVTTKSINGAIDTGSGAVVLPFDNTEIIDEINKKVDLQPAGGHFYSLSCKDANKIPSLTINIDGYDHVINGTQLAVPRGNDRCLLLLNGPSGLPELILGDPFIRDRCVSQNVETKEVSFAHRK